MAVDGVPAAPAPDMVAARLDRLPFSSFHIKVRLILGIATFFDAVDLLAISFALPAIAGPWQLSPVQIGGVISAAFAGQIIGAFLGGWAAELIGRLRTVAFAVAIFGLMSLACAFAWNAESLMAFRFIQGIGLGAEVPVATTYIGLAIAVLPGRVAGDPCGLFAAAVARVAALARQSGQAA
jgi:putative MFS transporter